MIYELRNKIPRDSSFLTSEDVLTSTVFGNLRYFSNQNLLISFLNKAIDSDGRKLEINDGNFFNFNFWEKYNLNNNRKYNEPDLYLNNDNYDIIIECKYYSFLREETIISKENSTEYSNQLIRYSKIIEKSEKNKIVIYLTNDVEMPIKIMRDSLKKINKNIKLYWLSWRILYRVMYKFVNYSFNHGEQQLFNDLFLFLKKRNLTVFCGFNLKKIESHWKYCKKYHYFTTNQLKFDRKYNYSPREFLNFN
jgi:hypothetical protein